MAKAVRNFCVQENGKLSTIQLAVLAGTSKVNQYMKMKNNQKALT